MTSEITSDSEPMSSESIPTTNIIWVVTFNLEKPCFPPKFPDQQILGYDFYSLRAVLSSAPESAMKSDEQSSGNLTAKPTSALCAGKPSKQSSKRRIPTGAQPQSPLPKAEA